MNTLKLNRRFRNRRRPGPWDVTLDDISESAKAFVKGTALLCLVVALVSVFGGLFMIGVSFWAK